MEEKNDISIGLWKTISKEGIEYYKGIKGGTEINGKQYRVTLFTNAKKKSEKSPDMTIKIVEIKEEDKKEVQVPQNTKVEYSVDSDIQINDEDLPF